MKNHKNTGQGFPPKGGLPQACSLANIFLKI